MEVISDSQKIFPRIETDIKKFGHHPEHNLRFLFDYSLLEKFKLLYFSFEGRGGALFYRKEKICRIISEPIAGKEAKTEIFLKSIDYLFDNEEIRKMELEDCTADLRKEILKSLPVRFRAIKPCASAIWPIIDLRALDENLKGKKWKRFRYVKNLFLKNPQFEIVNPLDVDKALLKKLVLLWKAQRKIRERVEYPQYLKAIEDGFSGCDIKKAVLVNKNPVALAAGWGIPNGFGHYIFTDLHDYRFPHLGEFLIFNYFLEAKSKGYQFIDFGGSDEGLLAYKNKFFPVSYYKTYDFSIVKK